MRQALARVGLALAAVLLILALWQGMILLFALPAYVLPPPAAAGGEIAGHIAQFGRLGGQTLAETAIGYVAGAALGFVLAVAMGQSALVQRLLYPALITSQAVPIVAIAAPLVILFGFGLTPKLIIVAWVVFFPVVVSVLDGLARVDRDMVALARALGGSSWRIFRLVRLPATLGPLFSGLKIGATYAVTGAVIGEWTASATPGLGTFLLTANAQLNTAGVYAAVLLLTLIGVCSFLLVCGFESLLTPWQSRATVPAWMRAGGVDAAIADGRADDGGGAGAWADPAARRPGAGDGAVRL